MFWLSLSLSLGFLLPGVAAAQDPPTKDQARCIVELNKSFAKVASAQDKHQSKCFKDVTKGKSPGPLSDCIRNTSAFGKDKVAGAKAKTLDTFDKKCAGNDKAGVPRLPGFGPTDPNLASAVAMEKELSLIERIFQDLDDPNSVPSKEADKDKNKCQLAVYKAVAKCQDTKLKVFTKCKQVGLKAGTITDPDGLVACLRELAGSSKVQKACLTAGSKLESTIDKKCTDPGNLDAFLGCNDPVVPPDSSILSACLDRFVECHVCLALAEADGLEPGVCDEIDDGELNGSCVDEPEAAVCDPDPFLEAGEDLIPNSTARVSVLIEELGPNPITLELKGPVVIQRGEPTDPGDGQRTIETEIVAMDLTSSSPVPITLRESPSLPSPGVIRAQQPGSDFPADSFFDVFVEIEIGGPGGTLVHNGPEDPFRMEAEINCLPPYGRNYLPAVALATPLLDPDGNQIGTLTHAIHQVDPVLDHFKLYQAQSVPGAVLDGPLVTIVDQFGSTNLDLGPVEFLLPPVSKDGGQIFRPGDHLLCYDVPNQTFGPAQVQVDNQFGSQTITVTDPETFCVPTEKALGPLASLPLQPRTDHFECYLATGVPPRIDPDFPIVVDLRDQFEEELGMEIGPPVLFCNPAEKTTADGTVFPVRDPAGHLTCYELVQPPTFGPLQVNIRNQFHPDGAPAEVNNPLALCVPGAKGAVTLGCDLPDLIVRLLNPPTRVSCPGGQGTCVHEVDFEVENVGDTDAGSFDVLVTTDHGLSSTVPVPTLAAGATTAVLTATLGPGDNCYNPNCIVTVEADSTDAIEECTEDDNTDSRLDLG